MKMGMKHSNYLPMLDGWRAIAILMVLACHSAAGGAARLYDPHATRLMGMLGPAGVEIFFGLSGFLITWRLLHEYHQSGTIRLSNFYRRRIFRILPAAFLYLVLMRVTGDLGWVRIDPTSWWGSIFFFRNYLSPDRDWVTLHFWSLAVEEHFYLFWPLLLALLAPRRALKASLAIIAAVVVWRACDWNGLLSHHWIPEANFWFRTDTRIDFLLWGCVAALLCEHPPFRSWLSRSWVFPAAGLGYLAGMGGAPARYPVVLFLDNASSGQHSLAHYFHGVGISLHRPIP